MLIISLYDYFSRIELKCLQIILNDEMKSKALEDDCREKLQQRVEMFNNAAAVSIIDFYMYLKVFLILFVLTGGSTSRKFARSL